MTAARLSELQLVRLGLASYSPGRAVLPPAVDQIAAESIGPVQYSVYRAPLETVVAFAGTNERRDWRRHWRFLRRPLPPARQTLPGRLLSFHAAWMADAAAAEAQLRRITYPAAMAGRPLTVLGHSYGGPLAAWLAFAVAVECCGAAIRGRTWGAPHPADRDLAQEFRRLVPDFLAYENPGDIVARVPLTGHRLGRRIRLPFRFPAHGLHRYAAAIATEQAAGTDRTRPPQTTKNAPQYPPQYPTTPPASKITSSSPVTPTREDD